MAEPHILIPRNQYNRLLQKVKGNDNSFEKKLIEIILIIMLVKLLMRKMII